MAWNPSPKVADCRDIARKWGVQQVIIIAVNRNNDTAEYASYGETRALCDETKQMADVAYEALFGEHQPLKGNQNGTTQSDSRNPPPLGR
jgi:hypothetical protein